MGSPCHFSALATAENREGMSWNKVLPGFLNRLQG